MAYVRSWISLDNNYSVYMSLTPETKYLNVINGYNVVKIQGHGGKCPASHLCCRYINIYEVSTVWVETLCFIYTWLFLSLICTHTWSGDFFCIADT